MHVIAQITNFNSIRLIPDMNFTCSGAIKMVTVTGMLKRGGQRKPIKLQTWRPGNATEYGRYHQVNSIELPSNVCKMDKLKKMMFQQTDIQFSEYVCVLKNDVQMLVEPGDILGLEIPTKPNANFELYSLTESGLTNYIFERTHDLQLSTIDLCNRTNETTVLPLVRVTVKVNPSRTGEY